MDISSSFMSGYDNRDSINRHKNKKYITNANIQHTYPRKNKQRNKTVCDYDSDTTIINKTNDSSSTFLSEHPQYQILQKKYINK